jgi:hypothetical protein
MLACKTTLFDKKLLILTEKVNKNYRLPLKRLYEMRILENHDNRKLSFFRKIQLIQKSNLTLPPTTKHFHSTIKLRLALKMSFLRKQESISSRDSWTPACAGVTNWELLEVPLSITVRNSHSFHVSKSRGSLSAPPCLDCMCCGG